MWSEWRVPPLFPNHPAFIHPAILQDPTSWDNVMWETDQMNARAAATIYVNILWKGIFAKARAEAWHLPYPWELKICSSEGFRTGWPLQLLRGSDKIIYLPDGRFQPYSGSPDAYLRKLWEFWWKRWRTQTKMGDHSPEFIQNSWALRRDDPVDLDMPVFPHLYIEYVVGQTIEHYVEQSRVKAPYRTISRRMFSDIEVEIGIAFSSRRQVRTTWASPARNRGSFPRHGELGRHTRRGKDIIISRRNARRNGSIEPSKASTTRMRANNAASVLARPRGA